MEALNYKSNKYHLNIYEWIFLTAVLFSIGILSVNSVPSHYIFGDNSSIYNDSFQPKQDGVAMCGAVNKSEALVQSKPYTGTKRAPFGSNTNGLLKWSLGSSWFGSKPSATDDVLIPSGSVVLLDENITVKSIRVEGKLIVDLFSNITINTENIIVSGTEGYFEWGTEAELYTKKGNITLVGEDASTDNKKVLMAMGGGTIEIHGKTKKSWVHLDGTVGRGQTKITVDDNISSWEEGDKIVITSTDYNLNNSEERTIKTIIGNTITLTQALDVRHHGKTSTYKNGMTFDERAEVALLSRNIIIQGDADGVKKGLGGHIMIMPSSTAHVEGVELFNMGQTGIKGRYPFHWHLCGDVPGQYIKSSSIHHTFQRLVVIHGTNRALVQDNVGYFHRGHGYFLEDGDEEFNVFRRNIGIRSLRTSKANRVEVEDDSPATFWITNPNNTFVGNVATGSDDAGFWVIPLTNLLRSGATLSKGGVPRDYPLLNFNNNVAHSNKRNLLLDSDINGDKPLSDDNRFKSLSATYPLLDINKDTLEFVFKNFTSYKGSNRGIWTRAGAADIYDGCIFGDSPFMAFLSFNSSVKNSMFVAQTDNYVAGNSDYDGGLILGAQMYNGSTDFENVHLAGFTDNKKIAIGTRQSSGKYPNFTSKNMTFEESDVDFRVNLGKFDDEEDPARSFAFVSGMIDLDGSITGTAGARLAPRIYNTKSDNPAFDNRIFDEEFNQPKQKNRQVTGLPTKWNAVASTVSRYAMLFNITGADFEEKFINQTEFVYGIRNDGPVVCDQMRKNKDSQWPVIVNEDYIYYSQYHNIPESLESRFQWTTKKDDYVIAAYLNMPATTSVKDRKGNNIPKVNTLNLLKNSSKTAYFFEDNTLYIKYFASDPDASTNTSVRYFDYSNESIYILQDGADNKSKGKLPYAMLADFEIGVDKRANTTGTEGITAATITGNGTNPNDGVDNSNSFVITQSSKRGGYLDYNLEFTRQVWREFKTLDLNYTGSDVEVLVKDQTSGLYSLGLFSATDTRKIDLTSIPLEFSDEIIGLTLRFHDCYLTANKTTIELFDIRLKEAKATTPSVSSNIPIPSISYTDNAFCPDESIRLSSSLRTNYSWFKDGVLLPTETGRNIDVSITGDYRVLGENARGCSFFSDPVNVSQKTGTQVTITSPTNNSVLSTPDFIIETTRSGSLSEKIDFLIDGVIVGTETRGPFSYSVTGLSTGKHKLEALVTNKNSGCTHMSSPVNITIDKITSTNTGVGDLTLEVYPNPNNTGIYYLNKSINWKIYNALGADIKEGNGKIIDLSDSENGVYFIKTETAIIKLILNY